MLTLGEYPQFNYWLYVAHSGYITGPNRTTMNKYGLLAGTKFKDVATLYQGQRILTQEGVGVLNEVSVNPGYPNSEPISSYDLVRSHLTFSEVKPLLKRIEDLSPHDKDIIRSLGMDPDQDLAAAGRAVAYLLSTGFDLFGLIDNGEAIEIGTVDSSLRSNRASNGHN